MTHLSVTQIEVVIGPFRRQMFAEGLAVMLRSEVNLNLTQIATEAEARHFLNCDHPTVVILEARAGEAARALLPESDTVAVILIAQEGCDVQIALRQFDRDRLRAAIGMVSMASHPRVSTLDAEGSEQPAIALPGFRYPQTSGLGTVIAWLDGVFALAMAEYADARGPTGPAIDDAEVLKAGFERGQAVSREDLRRRFEALEAAPMWQARLRRNFGLDATELKLLCLAAAPDLDHRYAQVIGLMQNDYAQGRPNATTLARLLGGDLIGADIDAVLVGPRTFARLRMIRPLESAQPQPGFRIAPSLLDLMIGARRLAASGWRLQRRGLPPQQALSDQIAAYLALPNPPVLLCGQDKHGADEVAAAFVQNGAPVLRVQVAELKGDVVEAVADLALIARLQDAVLMFEGLQRLPEAVQAALSEAETATLVRGTVMIGSTVPVPEGRDAVHVSIGRPGPAVQARRWQIAGAESGLTLSIEEAQRLGGVLRLGLSDVAAVIAMAAGHRRLGAKDAPEALVLKAASHVAAQHAPETVRRPDCIFDWDDIVLPKQIKTMVQSVPDHVRHASLVLDHWGFSARLPYGRGVGALFAGPSGTGKTMCAQVIARALGVELMQVELARCVSKYIGETEKNIDRCFDAAETASAVLLFDEADALFGKRTEIKDAHDRHANVEVAYLLQRIEAYEGLVILTSNLKGNIDPAFLRRLRFVVDFPMPEARDRERIWSLAIPRPEICADDVDTAFLARRLPLSGGSIQAVAVNAAFEAASEGCEIIHMRHVMAATRAELIKNGMLSAERALSDPEPAVLEVSLS